MVVFEASGRFSSRSKRGSEAESDYDRIMENFTAEEEKYGLTEEERKNFVSGVQALEYCSKRYKFAKDECILYIRSAI